MKLFALAALLFATLDASALQPATIVVTTDPTVTVKITRNRNSTSKTISITANQQDIITVTQFAATVCSPTQPTTLIRTQTCPTGTTGTWTQTSTYTLQPLPACWVAGAWTPDTAPVGSCVPTSSGSGTATLAWALPLTNANGATPANVLVGFRIYYGTTSGTYLSSVLISNPAATSGAVTGLATGTWYFTVVAVDSAGNESSVSYETSKAL